MTPEKFRALQLVQASIMDEIHRVCVKNNLKYYMIGGTALGAVRHKGFIPWDVDIDIAMPREDYEKFIEIANDELDSRYECLSYKKVKFYISAHMMVVLKNSSIKLENDDLNDPIRHGIYVDVLPLDQVPLDHKERVKHARMLDLASKLKYYKNMRVYSKDNTIRKLVKSFLRLLFSGISYYWLNDFQQKIAMKYNSLPDTGEICSTLSHYKYEKLCMSKKIWGTPKLYEFEGRQYYGAEDINAYLTNLFGDYMKLPPLSVQEDLRRIVVDAQW